MTNVGLSAERSLLRARLVADLINDDVVAVVDLSLNRTGNSDTPVF